ncbi:hypothetical protein L3N51_01905 [Metallosphaera sp. J1]|uniref:hypothetical protein n=1 Tax=Metallosphaera javensis (ex Hofmann et al. 2022) TaxID=99938 RepID=UPI001EDE0469|nr:hypothetical protein [Metallosphaera javensis (ex Hofmann et al. 2022)]MCG3109610.1 hypothetical protein [Metallosphaera javensis (ex Hofmann et al. 2022)]
MASIFTLRDLVNDDLSCKKVPSRFFCVKKGSKTIIGRESEGIMISKVEKDVLVIKYIDGDLETYQILRYDDDLPMIADGQLSPSIKGYHGALREVLECLDKGKIEEARNITVKLLTNILDGKLVTRQ